MKRNKLRIVMQGGLGNQLFQYAFYLRLSQLFPSADVVLDGWAYRFDAFHHGIELTKLFDTELKRTFDSINASRGTFGALKFLRPQVSHLLALWYRLKGYHTIYDTQIDSDETLRKLVAANRKLTLGGYFQTSHHAESVRTTLLSQYHPQLSARNCELMNSLKGNTLVAIHIRRGDYLKIAHYGVLNNLQYYHRAISYIREHVERPHFVVFSDDPSWAKFHLPLENSSYVDWNNGNESFQDLLLMSLCHHQIIANSSFSWWAAFLNQHPKKIVIAPKLWFANKSSDSILPRDWIQIDNE